MGITPGRLVAHTPREGTEEWHDLDDHLRAVGDRAAGHAAAFGAEALGRWVGTHHDLGKASPAFQAYLRACHADPKRKHQTTDHKGAGTWSTAGCRTSRRSRRRSRD